MAPTKSETDSKKASVLKAPLSTTKSTAPSARKSSPMKAVSSPMSRGPARVPGQRDDVNERMIRYRNRQKQIDDKVTVVKHLCGDPVGQLKKRVARIYYTAYGYFAKL